MSVRKRAMAAFIRWLAIILAGIAILSCLMLLSQDPVRRCDTLGKHMYNNLALPAPPEWDPAEYPYAYIYYVGETPTLCTLVLVPAEAEIVYEDGTSAILFSTPYYKSYSARTVDEQWADDGITQTSGSIYLFKPMISYPEDYIILQWTNFNVYTKDNELIFPKSDPDPVEDPVPDEEKFDLKSWLTGFALGLAGKPLPLSQESKEPVAYLYNGVRMPPLPDWDKEKYPYAAIMLVVEDSYVFRVFPEGAYYSATGGGNRTFRHDGTTMSANILMSGSASWNELKESEGGFIHLNKTIWSNFDLLNADGSVYLAASDPIPVYE